jgi:tRNA uridine 5-carboxymethylaminomethyl modification enzyme
LKTVPENRFTEILESAEIQIKYSGYIEREKLVADKYRRLENVKIKDRFEYDLLHTISTEARQKLKEIQPETIGQASRISGVSPSDINVLLVLLGR